MRKYGLVLDLTMFAVIALAIITGALWLSLLGVALVALVYTVRLDERNADSA